MATTNELTLSNDNELTSPSNAIDQMISMSIYDHNDPNSQNSEKSLAEQINTAEKTASPRYGLLTKEVMNVGIRLKLNYILHFSPILQFYYE